MSKPFASYHFKHESSITDLISQPKILQMPALIAMKFNGKKARAIRIDNSKEEEVKQSNLERIR